MHAAIRILLAAALAASLQVAPDIDERLAKYKRVEMPFSFEGYTARERTLVNEMIAACRDLENIYWRQNNPEDIALYNKLRVSADPHDRAVAHYIWINGSRFDQLEENKPFIGTGEDVL
jgi:hypothetical protein